MLGTVKCALEAAIAKATTKNEKECQSCYRADSIAVTVSLSSIRRAVLKSGAQKIEVWKLGGSLCFSLSLSLNCLCHS
jgi:hypothetical protein